MSKSSIARVAYSGSLLFAGIVLGILADRLVLGKGTTSTSAGIDVISVQDQPRDGVSATAPGAAPNPKGLLSPRSRFPMRKKTGDPDHCEKLLDAREVPECPDDSWDTGCLLRLVDSLDDMEDPDHDCESYWGDMCVFGAHWGDSYRGAPLPLATQLRERLRNGRPRVQLAAAWLLGTYHLVDAIGDLLDHIDLVEHRACLRTRTTPWVDRAAFHALWKIGYASLPPAVAALPSQPPGKRRIWTLDLIDALVGTPEAIHQLELAREKATDPAARTVYEESIRGLKEWAAKRLKPQPPPPPWPFPLGP